MNDLQSELQRAGIDIPPDFSGKIQRNGPQWLIGYETTHNGHTYQVVTYGDWKTSLKCTWRSGLNGAENDPELARRLNEMFKLQSEERRRAKHAFQESQAIKLWDEWEKCFKAGESTYLAEKGLGGGELFGARMTPNGDLIIPMVDIEGRFWNFQRIGEANEKRFQFGARITGCLHVLSGTLGDECKEIYLAEGFATAASISLSLGSGVAGVRCVCSAFNSGNLGPVAMALREKYSRARIIICADNDALTVINGVLTNVGVNAARQAAAADPLTTIVVPSFREPRDGLTDWNDLHTAEGLEMVRSQLLKQPDPVSEPAPEAGEKAIKPAKKAKKEQKEGEKEQVLPEKPKISQEKLIAENILKRLGTGVLRQGETFFLYNGTHWVEQDSMGRDKIKQLIGKAAEGRLDSRKINGAWSYLWIHMPQVPDGVDFFKPNPYCANFSNGTLHLVGKELALKPHSLTDYLISVLPFDCPPLDGAVIDTPIFDKFLERMWPKESERAANTLLSEELIGACFMPAYPTIVALIGPSGSGKSTLLKLFNNLMSENNVSHVDLADFSNFGMETMVGKLVNINTEMDTERPIRDAQVKRVIDRTPVRIERKYKTDVIGFLPAVHMFGTNDLPRSKNGTAKAYGRRFIFVACDEVVQGERPEQCYEDTILKAERLGIVARGLRGLRRLIEAGGYYTKPANSAKLVDEMQRASDPVAQYFEDIKEGAFENTKDRIEIGENRAIKPEVFWARFKDWQEIAIAPQDRIGRNAFYRRIKSMGFETKSVKGYRTFRGVGSVNSTGH